MSLSAITITKNEEKTIQRCIDSVKTIAEEHIVVDSGSTDNTLSIAKEAGAKIVEHKWLGYGPQKNIGLEQAQGTWALFIDADEEITPRLLQEISKTIASPLKDFYWLRIVTVFLGKPLHHLYGHNPRLFLKSAGYWSDDMVHEQVETKNGVRIRLGDDLSSVLSEPLLHHSHQTIASYLKRMHHYTTLDAQQMLRTGKHRSGRKVSKSWHLPWFLALRQFFKLLIYRKGFLDGWQGFLWCYLSAYYEYEMAKKFINL